MPFAPAPRVLLLLLMVLAPLSAPAVGAEPPSSADAEAEAVLARINVHRARQGLVPLRLNTALSRAAAAHSRDMVERDFFAHSGSDGSTAGVRAQRAGYAWRRIAENIAGGMAEPEEAVAGWMGSEGHRLNVLEPAFRDAGVGHAVATPDPGHVRYRHYWTLMLGAPGEP